eukprot:scaffold515093_cov19-Prasinocladus_malaysianus.AAC.1
MSKLATPNSVVDAIEPLRVCASVFPHTWIPPCFTLAKVFVRPERSRVVGSDTFSEYETVLKLPTSSANLASSLLRYHALMSIMFRRERQANSYHGNVP